MGSRSTQTQKVRCLFKEEETRTDIMCNSDHQTAGRRIKWSICYHHSLLEPLEPAVGDAVDATDSPSEAYR